MNKNIKIAIICLIVVLVTGTTAFATVHFSNFSKEEETTQNIKLTAQTSSTTSTTEKTTNPAIFDKSFLTEYYWGNNIQSPYVYEFKDDNTLIEYEGRLEDEKSYWTYVRTLKYSIDNDTLVIDFGDDEYSWVVKLKYITKSENLDWDKGFAYYDIIAEDEYFFYETSFVDTGLDSENAKYLIKDIHKKDSSDFLSEEEAKDLLIEVLGTEDNMTAYKYEDKIRYKGKLYYAFRATQLIDNHSVTIGEYFVSDDGTKIYDGDAYGGEYNFANLTWKK